MEQLYTLLKNSINEEMGWMIDHIYEDYKDTEDILGFALSCEKIYVFIMGQTFMNRLEICLFMFSMFT